MPIISKTTWEKFTQEEKKKICSEYMKWQEEAETNPFFEGKVNNMEDLFGKENLQTKPLTYEDVARELFEHDGIDDKSHFATIPCMGMKWDNKLQAIGRLLVVAKFLNKDWKPDWENADEEKWFPCIGSNGKIEIHYATRVNYEIVYFRTEELAKQAENILGEDTVRLALDSSY